MKPVLSHFLHHTEKRIVFKSSKDFFYKMGIKPDFAFEDLEVMSYLLNKEVSFANEGLREIAQEKLSFCYNQVEKQMPFVLSKMEKAGVLASIPKLQALEQEIVSQLSIIKAQIISLAGRDFNINSPKQVNEVLFEKLGLKGGKKTASGGFSTSGDVLEELASEGSEIAKKLIESRHLSKLLSTYIEVLLQKTRESKDGRVRTTFSSTSTLTGRLNSKNPNMQNLPAKSEIGAKIKNCFMGADGMKLISFDYSQIELRILAHIANIEPLKEAFLKGEDVHKKTASTMFEIPLESVSKEARSYAKTINFGIIYGLSAFALGKTLGVETGKANEYMKAYFAKYDGIERYMKETEEIAKRDGFVRTMLGKKCYLEGLNSSNYSVRSHAVRAGINARIQGSSADLIKKAMIDLQEILNDDCKLILQIHDELVFEIKEDLVETLAPKIKHMMENAIKLSIPIEVNQKLFASN
jgi:DNA polymerase-1